MYENFCFIPVWADTVMFTTAPPPWVFIISAARFVHK